VTWRHKAAAFPGTAFGEGGSIASLEVATLLEQVVRLYRQSAPVYLHFLTSFGASGFSLLHSVSLYGLTMLSYALFHYLSWAEWHD